MATKISLVSLERLHELASWSFLDPFEILFLLEVRTEARSEPPMKLSVNVGTSNFPTLTDD